MWLFGCPLDIFDKIQRPRQGYFILRTYRIIIFEATGRELSGNTGIIEQVKTFPEVGTGTTIGKKSDSLIVLSKYPTLTSTLLTMKALAKLRPQFSLMRGINVFLAPTPGTGFRLGFGTGHNVGNRWLLLTCFYLDFLFHNRLKMRERNSSPSLALLFKPGKSHLDSTANPFHRNTPLLPLPNQLVIAR
jgi:hypothetical protein